MRDTSILPLLSAASAALLLLTGCDPGGPDGKNGVLFFRGDRGVAEGSWGEVLVPSSVNIGGGKATLDRSESFTFDFEGTALELSAPAGTHVEEQWLDEYGWHFRIACVEAQPEPAELAVKVTLDGAVKYEDAFDLRCARPDAHTLTTVIGRVFAQQSDHPQGGVWIDEHEEIKEAAPTFLSNLELHAQVHLRQGDFVLAARSSTPEGTSHLEMVKNGGKLDWSIDETAQQGLPLVIRTDAPGTGGELKFGAYVVPLPWKVIAEDAWKLSVATTAATTSSAPQFKATAVMNNGTVVHALRGCSTTAKLASGQTDEANWQP